MFQPTTQIFNSIDNITQHFVAANISNVIALVTPWIALGLTIALMAQGVTLMASPGSEPLSGLFKKFIRYAIVIAIASAGGLYQTQLAGAALQLPEAIGSALVFGAGNVVAQGGTASVIDQTLAVGMDAAAQAFEAGGMWDWVPILLGSAILVITVALCALGAGLILMAKFMLALTVCFGPIFIFALLFKPTEALFGKWVGAIINYTFVTVLLTAVFGLVMQFFYAAVEDAATPGGGSLLPTTVAMGLIALASWFILKKVPEVAASWGEGVHAAATGFAQSGVAKGGAMGAGAAIGGAIGAGKAAAQGGGAEGAARGAASGAKAGAMAGAGNMKGLARGSRKAA